MNRCIICSAEFQPKPESPNRRIRSDRITCSSACRQRLHRRRASGGRTTTDLPGQKTLFDNCDSRT